MSISLQSLGWNSTLAAEYTRYDRRGNKPGRVVRVDRGVCTIVTGTETVRASLAGRMLGIVAADALAMPSVGDWAVVRNWGDARRTIEAVLPRRSAIVRLTAGKSAEGQAIAANADTVAVMESLDPDPDHGRIERLAALAYDSGCEPILILSKCDTVADPWLLAEDLSSAMPNAPVIPVSTVTGMGLEALAPYVSSGRTLALLGASGAGKSSLVNALAGTDVMATRGLRGDGRGRHTTSHRSLVSIPGGGAVIDTPGLRAVGMFDRRPGDAATRADGLARAFDDLEELAAQCRFNDCRHDTEPGCAVRAAVDDGVITARRLENWRKLQRERTFERSRADARARAQSHERTKPNPQARHREPT